MKIKIVIPAKGHSVRVPNKNLRPFYNTNPLVPESGKSLLEICIEKVKELDLPIVVNSESPEVLALAERMGVTPQERPPELSTPDTTPSELARHIAEANSDAEYILYVHCTNPLIGLAHFRVALQLPPEKWGAFDSLNSAYFVQKHIWNGREALYDTLERPGTQEIKEIRALEYSINIIATEKLLRYGDFVGKNPAFIMIPHSQVIDIDEEIDFEVAQVLYKKRQTPLK